MALSINEDCLFVKLSQKVLNPSKHFSCGDEDLDDFFANDSIAYDEERMGKTYCWVLREDDTKIIAMVTLANAGIHTTHLKSNPKRKLNKNISYPKRGRTYPAVLIGRLGVNIDYQGSNYRVGAQIMDFIKNWFKSADNKTGCRFVLVDAVNNPHAIRYYERNGFTPLFPKIED